MSKGYDGSGMNNMMFEASELTMLISLTASDMKDVVV
jgi:hypothetical protein